MCFVKINLEGVLVHSLRIKINLLANEDSAIYIFELFLEFVHHFILQLQFYTFGFIICVEIW